MADLLKKIEKVPPNQARKRGVNKENWKRERKRRELYASKSLPQAPQCNHSKKTTYRCSTINMQDISRMHRNFYKMRNKVDQDNFILQHCRITKCSRIRPKNESRRPKTLNAEYYVTIKNPHKQIRVCKSAFLKILNVGKDRVTGILQRSYKDGGSTAKENRGGNHKGTGYAEKRRRVEEFIESLEAAEPHYCRAKSSIRLYLPPELNIVKLWKMYQEQVQETPQLKVKHSFFRDIFNKKYNVGFGSPLKDTCSRCFELSRKIETACTNQEKVTFMTQKRIHTLKAKAFYELLKVEPENTKSLSFDCQKNNPLPKLPDQAAYFSRQFNIYNFTVVIGTSKSTLNTSNVRTYYWCENEHSKSSNEISSAVFHTLTNLVIPDNINKIRLFADGCGGQNKNTTLVAMCSNWLFAHAPIHVNQLEIIFPMVGHSFLPPDRIFAKIEKETKKKSIICDPQIYVNLFKEHATVYHLGDDDVEVRDWKKETTTNHKPPGSWHFKFNPSKRFMLHRGRQNISVQGEENYRCETGQPKYVTKRGKNISNLTPAILRRGNKVNVKKILDVANLLKKHFGEDWRNIDSLKYFKDIEENNDNFEEHENIQCVELEENENFI